MFQILVNGSTFAFWGKYMPFLVSFDCQYIPSKYMKIRFKIVFTYIWPPAPPLQKCVKRVKKMVQSDCSLLCVPGIEICSHPLCWHRIRAANPLETCYQQDLNTTDSKWPKKTQNKTIFDRFYCECWSRSLFLKVFYFCCCKKKPAKCQNCSRLPND